MSVPVVLDVDTGLDDACALLLAALHPGLDLRAVTCVAGNTDVEQVVRNTVAVLASAGRPDVPVARGAARPLLGPSRPARHVHGEDGMGDLDHCALGLPPVTAGADPRHAVQLLRDVLLDAARRGEAVTLVPLAPMTNIALLLRTHPEVASGIARIVFMGGSTVGGNATAAAEFNVWHDPESAAIVLDAARELEVPVLMYGLDVFDDVRVTRAQAAELLTHDHPAARLGGALVRAQCERFGTDDATVGDAGAVLAVVDPSGLRTAHLPLHVELGGVRSRGQTVVDRRGWVGDVQHDPHGAPATPVDVALEVAGPRWAALWCATLTARSIPR